MDLLHVALTSISEDRADRFYVDLLGLRKVEPKILAGEIGRALFGVDRELTVINYIGGGGSLRSVCLQRSPHAGKTHRARVYRGRESA